MKLLILAFALIATAFAHKRCVIPCTREYNPLCGSDGRTYANECAMRVAACISKEAIIAIRNGKCPDDDGKRCIFPCPKIYKPVCGSDNKMYPNECAMRGAACHQKKAITVVSHFSKHHSCADCSFLCTSIYQPICGSDGKTYPSKCFMAHKACVRKTAIITVYKGVCREE